MLFRTWASAGLFLSALTACLLQVGCGPSTREKTAPSFAMVAKEGAKASSKNPQVVNGNVFEDYDYSFKITRPSPDWEFLAEAKAVDYTPDACMGAINLTKNAFMMVIVEEGPDTSLAQYEANIADNFAALDSTVIKREERTLQKHPAIYCRIDAKISGVDFKYINIIVKRDGFFYQVNCWTQSMKFAAAEAEFHQLWTSLQFGARKPEARTPPPTADQTGDSWQIAGNVFSSMYAASAGLRLTPPEGLDLVVGDELETIAPQALVALTSDSGMLQFYSLQATDGTADDMALKNPHQLTIENLGLADKKFETTDVKVGGIAASQRMYRDVPLDGGVFHVAMTHFVREGDLFVIDTLIPAGDQNGMKQLAATRTALQWLTAAEQSRLTAAILKADTNNAVGLDFSYRNNVFRDYQSGYQLELPSGLWQVLAGDNAREDGLDFADDKCRLFAHSVADRVTVEVYAGQLKATAQQYHLQARAAMLIDKDTPVKPVTASAQVLLQSSGETESDGVVQCFRLVTASQGDTHVQLVVSTWKSNEAKLDPLLKKIVQSFKLKSDEVTKVTRSPRSLIDTRMGYRLDFEPAWNVHTAAIPGSEPVSSLTAIHKRDIELVAMAICMKGGLPNELAVESIANKASVDGAISSRSQRETVFAGLPASELTLQVKKNPLSRGTAYKGWIVNRGNTTYIFMITYRNGQHASTKPFEKMFSLID